METSLLIVLGVIIFILSFLWMRKDKGFEPKIAFFTSLAGLISLIATPEFNSEIPTATLIENQKQYEEKIAISESPYSAPSISNNQKVDSSLILKHNFNRIAITGDIDFEIDGSGNIKVIKKDVPFIKFKEKDNPIFGDYSEKVQYLIPINNIKKISIPKSLAGHRKILLSYNDGSPTSIYGLVMTNQTDLITYFNNKVKPYNQKIILESHIPDNYFVLWFLGIAYFLGVFYVIRAIYRFLKF